MFHVGAKPQLFSRARSNVRRTALHLPLLGIVTQIIILCFAHSVAAQIFAFVASCSAGEGKAHEDKPPQHRQYCSSGKVRICLPRSRSSKNWAASFQRLHLSPYSEANPGAAVFCASLDDATTYRVSELRVRT